MLEGSKNAEKENAPEMAFSNFVTIILTERDALS